MALADPATGIVGLEVHTPGVATMLQAIEAHGLDNVRVVHGDALVFLDRVGSGIARRGPDLLPRPVAEGAPAPPPHRRRRGRPGAHRSAA